MSLRAMLLGACLALGLVAGPSARAANNPLQARYAGRYFMVIRNFNNTFSFGGNFKVLPSGVVRGVAYNQQNIQLKFSSVISNQGRFTVNLINGNNLITASIAITSTGLVIGRDQVSQFPGTGNHDNPFFVNAGIYRGTLSDGRHVLFVIELNRRITGSFEQTPGVYAPLYGGATVAGFNLRSYLSLTKFSATFNTTNHTASGPWYETGAHGTFKVKRIPPPK